MAHIDQHLFIKNVLNKVNSENAVIIEYGSYDVNGHVRGIVSNILKVKEYVGIDLVKGPNVDVVENAANYRHNTKSNVGISCECLEHNPNWKSTIVNMVRNSDENGYLVLTFATNGRKEHGTVRSDPFKSPGTSAVGWNYYKNIDIKDLIEVIDGINETLSYKWIINRSHYDVYCVIHKNESNIDIECDFADLFKDKKIKKCGSNGVILDHMEMNKRLRSYIKYYLEKILGGALYQNLLYKFNSKFR